MPTSPTVYLSVDPELLWGFQDHDDIPTERTGQARESRGYGLNLFDEYRVPATWAVAGHRFLDRCDGMYTDDPAGREWFSRDPGGEFAPVSGWFDDNSVHDMHQVADGVKNSD